MSAVAIKDVSKQFKAGVTALQGIDLEVEPGEFVSLIGPSGCGKSTLLRIIGDLTKPTAGSVQVNGKPAERARRDHEYGIVFQDAVLYDWRTVAKNISLPLELLRWSRGRRTARVKDMVDLVELTGFESHHPWQLSGGMQQRVSKPVSSTRSSMSLTRAVRRPRPQRRSSRRANGSTPSCCGSGRKPPRPSSS